ncbi:MAG TPA: hypothetical protein VN253_03180 [Kofleriaceae bacterium]|nr:hypothetical protein [Kofleriaceae bacterium]
MWKSLLVLGTLVRLSVPSIAAAQNIPPQAGDQRAPSAPGDPVAVDGAQEPPPSAPAPPPPPSAPASSEPAPAASSPTDLDEPPPPPRQPTRPRDATLPRGGGPPPPEPAPTIPDRSGATFEMSLGFGITHVSLDDGTSKSFHGLSGLNLAVGGWISPRTALTVRLTGTSFGEPVAGVDVRFIAGLLGLSLQHMVSNALWIGGGVGIGVLTTDQDNITPERGLGLDLRAGINLYQSTQNAIHLAVEITPGFYDGLNVTGIGIQIGWQSL